MEKINKLKEKYDKIAAVKNQKQIVKKTLNC
jgi:hypothetical protein